jgi:nucleoside phosphorylase
MTMPGRKRDDDIHQHGALSAVRRRPSVEPLRGDRPTVGLITALPEEFAAVRGLLEDPADKYVSGDPARYTLGTMPSLETRPHVVALTMLGATATDAAADGCANMIRSYPSIDTVIMVGVAAGIPHVNRPDLHVRLGDIVVAEGIVEYDHVSVGPDGTRQRTGFPLPSARLMRCANILRTDELSGQRPWEQWLPGMAGYARPHERSDVVHDSAGYVLDHPRRDRSGHRKGFPKVHYGLIGSADRSLRDVATRDQLAAQHRVLAVEMEGAAIGTSSSLNGRDWFVVRGVSDYGDNQRNGVWRRYASLVAAAYVRSLLATCPPVGRADDRRNGARA